MKDKRAAWLGLANFLLFYLLYLKSLTPTFYFDDAGELIASAASLGVPHPTGYPLYALLGYIFSQIPLGSIAWRLNLLSLVAGALTVFLVWLIAWKHILKTRPLAACSASLFLGLSPVMWHNSTIAEVYSLNLFLLSGALYYFFQARRGAGFKLFLLLAGLSLGNHLTAVLFLPSLLFFLASPRQLRLFAKNGLLVLIICSALYLYLPLRSITNPQFNWGQPDNWNNFLWLVRGAQFSGRMFKGGFLASLGRLGATGSLFFYQLHLGLIPALIGMALLIRKRPGWGVFLTLAFLSVTVFTIGYDITPLNDWRAYFLPAWLILTLFIAVAIAHSRLPRWGYLLILLIPFLSCFLTPSLHLHRNEYSAYRDARFILNQLPENALVVNHDSSRTFSLMYLGNLENRRKGLTLLYAPLLNFDWYLTQLNRRGVLLPRETRGQLRYRDYILRLALLNQRIHSVYGFDWWPQNFPQLEPLGPLYKIIAKPFEPGFAQKAGRLEADYYDYVARSAFRIAPPLQSILSVHYAGLGSFLQRHSMFKEAIPYYYRSLEHNEMQPVLANNLAICLEKNGQIDEAITQYQSVIRLRPDYTSPYGNLGRLLYRLGRQQEAAAVITQALENNPRDELSVLLREDLMKIKNNMPLQ